MIAKIIRRNGEIVDFRPEKIQDAIAKAVQAVGGSDLETPNFLPGLSSKKLRKITPTISPMWKECKT